MAERLVLTNAVLAASVALFYVALPNKASTLLLVVAMLVSGAVALGLIPSLLSREPKPTPEGAQLRDHLLGLNMYLELAEQDRFRTLQSPERAERVSVTAAGRPDPESARKPFDSLLPFAVL